MPNAWESQGLEKMSYRVDNTLKSFCCFSFVCTASKLTSALINDLANLLIYVDASLGLVRSNPQSSLYLSWALGSYLLHICSPLNELVKTRSQLEPVNNIYWGLLGINHMSCWQHPVNAHRSTLLFQWGWLGAGHMKERKGPFKWQELQENT